MYQNNIDDIQGKTLVLHIKGEKEIETYKDNDKKSKLNWNQRIIQNKMKEEEK